MLRILKTTKGKDIVLDKIDMFYNRIKLILNYL